VVCVRFAADNVETVRLGSFETNRETLAYYAARGGHLEEAIALAAFTSSPSYKEILSGACIGGHTELIMHALQMGAKLSSWNIVNVRAVDPSLLSLLERENPEIFNKYLEEITARALLEPNREFLEWLLKRRNNAGLTSSGEYCPLLSSLLLSSPLLSLSSAILFSFPLTHLSSSLSLELKMVFRKVYILDYTVALVEIPPNSESNLERFKSIQFLYEIGAVSPIALKSYMADCSWMSLEQLEWVYKRAVNSTIEVDDSKNTDPGVSKDSDRINTIQKSLQHILYMISTPQYLLLEGEPQLPFLIFLTSKLEEVPTEQIIADALFLDNGFEVFRLLFKRFQKDEIFLENVPDVIRYYCNRVTRVLADGFSAQIGQPCPKLYRFQGEKLMKIIHFCITTIEHERMRVCGDGTEAWLNAVDGFLKELESYPQLSRLRRHLSQLVTDSFCSEKPTS